MSMQLEISHLTKTFERGTVNEKCALDDISLAVEKGEFITVLGSNGAGKSTLFNAILGKFRADRGRIILDGEDITQALVDGRACMVRVQKGESAHWLCVVGSTSEDFLVLDPAAGDGQARSLAAFGNVFALALFDAN